MPTKPAAITRLRDLKISAQDKLMIDPRIIVIETGHNPRDYSLAQNRQHLDHLKESIKVHGTIQPLWLRFDPETKSAVLVDGECRLRANLELIDEGVEIISVPAIQVKGNNEEDRLLLAMTANTGKPFSKWESGAAFRRLEKLGNTPEMIAQKTGFSVRFVNEALELADAPEELKSLLSQQAVTPALALETLRTHGAKAGAVLQEKVAESRQRAAASGKGPKSKGGKPKGKDKKPAPLKKSKKPADSVRVPRLHMKAIIDALEDAAMVKDKDLGEKAERALIFAQKAAGITK